MADRSNLLSSRARIVRGYYAVIPKEGRVENILPALEGCKATILASPKLGADFASYIIEAGPCGRTVRNLGENESIEYFLYVNEGTISVQVSGKRRIMGKGAYVYVPPGEGLQFDNQCIHSEIFLYKKKYIPLHDRKPWVFWGDTEKVEWKSCDGMNHLLSRELLPFDQAFDISFHILLFKKGGCHGFVETHDQEHGAFVLQGQGMYLLDTVWSPVEKGDFIWMGPYVPQAAYGIGAGEFSYLFSKDCNRDVIL
ncbi:(S)-ureidoglycine aminohydrolase [Clostridium sp. AM58-1XD]|uniref:(S)-ureidoglycine aminohydrolase n=1 Tax=Clostridium sp. AM58-1XD TaxID=2292307 RepID=UPI000E4CA5D2|nr:(S)-ureidoglycine aminohydrolase [Clostridium sp. AM58-1XD]RGZ00110.1 (S)-ureidoglycine aminohydrolase [Clostridium sp. AM58-1XD]